MGIEIGAEENGEGGGGGCMVIAETGTGVALGGAGPTASFLAALPSPRREAIWECLASKDGLGIDEGEKEGGMTVEDRAL